MGNTPPLEQLLQLWDVVSVGWMLLPPAPLTLSALPSSMVVADNCVWGSYERCSATGAAAFSTGSTPRQPQVPVGTLCVCGVSSQSVSVFRFFSHFLSANNTLLCRQPDEYLAEDAFFGRRKYH